MIKIIVFLILLICNINPCLSQGEKLKIITLLSSEVNDLGFNNMLNQGIVETAKYLNIEDSRVKVTHEYKDTKEYLESVFKNEVIDVVFCTSLSHFGACKDLAVNSTTNTKFVLRGSSSASKNLVHFTYNYATINYAAGCFAGLYTKTNNIGFLSPGVRGGVNDSFVYAFWYGAKKMNENINFYYYNIGSYIDVDKTVVGVNKLLELGVDMIGDTMDDFTTGNTVIQNGFYALGTNGFPQRNVYGENVVFSYSMNWTKLFVPIIEKYLINPKSIQSNQYGDLDNQFFDFQFGYSVNDTVLAKMKNESNYLARTPRAEHPQNCNHYVPPYAELHNFKMTGNLSIPKYCIAGSNFFYFNAPFPGMTYMGYIEILDTEVKFSPSIRIGISIASGILIALVLCIMGGVYKFRDTSSIRSASPIFLMFILSGAILVYVGIVVWVSDLNTHVCNARFWLVTLGFSIFIGSLVVKNFRIWLIFDNPELKTVRITNWQLYPWVGLCIIINIILMAILTSVGDLREVDAKGIDSLGKYEYMRICKMNHGGASTLYTILAYFAALLLIGVYISFKIRIVDIEEFNESKAIGQTLYAISFCLFVIVPLMISPQDRQSETIILCVAGFFIVTAAVLIIFFPKFYRVYQFGAEGTNEMFKSKKSSTIATARADSNSKNSGGSRKTNRRGNVVSGGNDFSDDEESSIADEVPVNKKEEKITAEVSTGDIAVTSGAVMEDFTEEDISENGGEKYKTDDVELKDLNEQQLEQ